MKSQALYRDYLVEITDRGIVFDWYYFPFGSKRVPFEDIEWIAITQLAPRAAKWLRIWGTGDFVTWFPLDLDRSKRSAVFQLKLRDKNKYVGFTVEDESATEAVIKARGLYADSKPPRQVSPWFIITIIAVVGLPIISTLTGPTNLIHRLIVALGSVIAVSSGLVMIMMIRTLAAFRKARAEFRRAGRHA